MINKYFFLVLLSFSGSCNAQNQNEENKMVKWYYYAYAMDLNGYRSDGKEIDPLTCDIKLNSKRVLNTDTSVYYFSLYESKTQDICYLKPLDLVGITVVKDKLYIPIYHSIIFDSISDDSILNNMKKQSALLKKRISDRRKEINSWLEKESQ